MMSKQTLRRALQKERSRRAQAEASERVERMVVANFPIDHNPYLPHLSGPSCEKVCAEGHAKQEAPR